MSSSQYLLESLDKALTNADRCLRQGDSAGLEKSIARAQRYIHGVSQLPRSSQKTDLLKSFCALTTFTGCSVRKGAIDQGSGYKKMEVERGARTKNSVHLPYGPSKVSKRGRLIQPKEWPVNKLPLDKGCGVVGKGREAVGSFTATVGKLGKKSKKTGKFDQQGGLQTSKSLRLKKKKSTKLTSTEGGLTQGKGLMKKSLRSSKPPVEGPHGLIEGPHGTALRKKDILKYKPGVKKPKAGSKYMSTPGSQLSGGGDWRSTKSLRSSLNKAKPESSPSLKPPKEWFDKHLAAVKKGNPEYSDEQAKATVGKIWFKNMSVGQCKRRREREGKKYGKASAMKSLRERLEPKTAFIVTK